MATVSIQAGKLASLAVAIALAAGSMVQGGAAFAQSIPEKTVTRDLVRRLLVDSCVYSISARAEADRKVVVDACQCSSAKFIKGVDDKDIAELQGRAELPGEWVRTVEAGTAQCGKR